MTIPFLQSARACILYICLSRKGAKKRGREKECREKEGGGGEEDLWRGIGERKERGEGPRGKNKVNEVIQTCY